MFLGFTNSYSCVIFMQYLEWDRQQTVKMKRQTSYTGWGMLVSFAISLSLSLYFTFAAVQGDYGLFRRAEVRGDIGKLRVELEVLEREIARMENLTKRMSDEFLDLDLLDQQARDILGYIGINDIVIR